MWNYNIRRSLATKKKSVLKWVQANRHKNSQLLEEVPFCTICEALRLPCHNISWWWWCQKPSRMSSRPWKRERSRLKQASPVQTSSWAGNCPHILYQTKALVSGQFGHPFSQDFVFPDFSFSQSKSIAAYLIMICHWVIFTPDDVF